MADATVTIAVADEADYIARMAARFPGDTVATVADTEAIIARWLVGCCKSSVAETEGSDGLASYTPPAIT